MVKGIGIGSASVVYALIGIIQIVATADGIQHLTGWWWLVCWMLAIFTGWMPIIGTGLGIYGAHASWEWSWVSSIGLFAGIPLFFVVLTFSIMGISSLYERLTKSS